MGKYMVLVTGLVALSACSEVSTAPSNLGREAAEVALASGAPVSEIVLVSGGTINGGNFTTLGEIDTSVGKATVLGKTPTLEDGEQKLRIEASKLGANAVINAQVSGVTVCPFSWGCRTVRGTAVRLP